jgi:hypothetical protein
VEKINTDALMKWFKESNHTDFTQYINWLSEYKTAITEIEHRTIRIGEQYFIFTWSNDQLVKLKSNIWDIKVKDTGKISTSDSNLASLIYKLIKKGT